MMKFLKLLGTFYVAGNTCSDNSHISTSFAQNFSYFSSVECQYTMHLPEIFFPKITYGPTCSSAYTLPWPKYSLMFLFFKTEEMNPHHLN